MPPAERQRYPFALHLIDWEEYLFKTHLPGIRKCGAVPESPGKIVQQYFGQSACCAHLKLCARQSCLHLDVATGTMISTASMHMHDALLLLRQSKRVQP